MVSELGDKTGLKLDRLGIRSSVDTNPPNPSLQILFEPTMKITKGIALAATVSTIAIATAPNCSVANIQAFVDTVASNGTTLSVEYARELNSSATINAWKSKVGAAAFQTIIPDICAFRINGSVNSTGVSFGLGVLVPKRWNERIM
jgi:hypothetical protein